MTGSLKPNLKRFHHWTQILAIHRKNTFANIAFQGGVSRVQTIQGRSWRLRKQVTTPSWKQNIKNSTFQAPSTSAKQQHWLPRGDKTKGEGGNKGHRCTSGFNCNTDIINHTSKEELLRKPSNCWISQVVGNQFINYCKQQEIPSFVVSDLFFHYRFYEIITEIFPLRLLHL